MPTLPYTPPAYGTSNVVYGTALVMTSPVGTSLPSDANLGVGSSWTGGGWSYVGATDSGVTQTWNPSTQDINIEEQPTPVAVLVTTASLQVSFNFSEETLANINMAYGNNGTIAVTAAGAGQPGKSVLSLSTTFAHVALAVVSKNQLGYARVFYVPEMMSAGQVQTAYRRAASQRLWACTFNTICPFQNIQVIDLTSPATS
jgi:hypothetical protein